MAGRHWFPNRSWRRRLIQCSLTFSRPNQWSEILGKFPSIFFQLIWNQCQLSWKPYHWKLSGECSLLSILGKQSQRSDSGASWNPTDWGGSDCFCRWPEILSKISRGGGACFCQSRNPLKNIKGWWWLFLPIRKSSQKYQGVAVLFSADDRKSSQKYQGVVVLVSANPEILSKISRGGGACWKKGTTV